MFSPRRNNFLSQFLFLCVSAPCSETHKNSVLSWISLHFLFSCSFPVRFTFFSSFEPPYTICCCCCCCWLHTVWNGLNIPEKLFLVVLYASPLAGESLGLESLQVPWGFSPLFAFFPEWIHPSSMPSFPTVTLLISLVIAEVGFLTWVLPQIWSVRH